MAYDPLVALPEWALIDQDQALQAVCREEAFRINVDFLVPWKRISPQSLDRKEYIKLNFRRLLQIVHQRLASIPDLAARHRHAILLINEAYSAMLHTHVRVVSLNRSLDDAERHHGLQHTIYKIRNSAAISKIFASQLGDFDWVEPGSLASPDFQRWCVQFHNNPSVGLPIFTSILKCFAVALQALLAIAPTEIRVRILQALHFYFEAVAHERVMWSNHKSLDPSRKAAREVALQRFKDVFGAVASSCGGFHPVNESCWKQNSTVPWQDGSILVVSLPDEADGTVDYYVCVGSLHDNRYKPRFEDALVFSHYEHSHNTLDELGIRQMLDYGPRQSYSRMTIEYLNVPAHWKLPDWFKFG